MSASRTQFASLGIVVSFLLLAASCSALDEQGDGSFSQTSTSDSTATVEPRDSTEPTAGIDAETTSDAPSVGETGAIPLIPNAQVLFVIDGDTIEADIDGIQETIRFIGIDTPEKTGGFRPAECYGDEASARMKQLLQPGDAIRLELDIEARDRFERLLAYVYSPAGLLNEFMVAEGYAIAIRFEPNTTLATRFEAAESSARELNLGLWRDCGSADVLLDPTD